MPLTTKRPARWSWRTLLPWAVGVLPLVCGLAVTRWQTERELQANSQATAREVVGHIEMILDSLSSAANHLLPKAGQPCEDVQLALRIEVTRNAFVRSTSLFDRDNLYCTSLFGNFDEPVDARDYTDGQLWLMDGNSVTPAIHCWFTGSARVIAGQSPRWTAATC